MIIRNDKQRARMPNDDFDWSGGHPALDLVNTFDERPSDAPEERLKNFADLVAFARGAEVVEPALAVRLLEHGGEDAENVVRRTRRLRENLYNILRALHLEQTPDDKDLFEITKAIRAAHKARTLVFSRDRSVASYAWDEPDNAEVLPARICPGDWRCLDR